MFSFTLAHLYSVKLMVVNTDESYVEGGSELNQRQLYDSTLNSAYLAHFLMKQNACTVRHSTTT